MSTPNFLLKRPRLGLSQGATLFWGLTSLVFAGSTCYYFTQNQANERLARDLQDDISYLKEQGQNLEGEQTQLRSANSDAENLLNTREQILKEKELMLAQKEAHLEGLESGAAAEQKNLDDETVILKYFNLCADKMVRGSESIVTMGTDNRPLLSLSNHLLFPANDTSLKSSGRELLNKLSQSLTDQLSNFEMRVEVYTDKVPEVQAGSVTGGGVERPLNPWSLTTLRAAALQRYFREQGNLPIDHITCVGRGDSMPPSGPAVADNRQTEIHLLPLVPPLPSGALDLIAPASAQKPNVASGSLGSNVSLGSPTDPVSAGPVVEQGPHSPPPDVPRSASASGTANH